MGLPAELLENYQAVNKSQPSRPNLMPRSDTGKFEHILKQFGCRGDIRVEKAIKMLWVETAERMGGAITVSPRLLGGLPCIRKTGISVRLVLDILAEGHTWDEIIINYPTLKPEDIKAAIYFAARLTDRPDDEGEM